MIHPVTVYDKHNNIKQIISGAELTAKHWNGFKDLGVDSIHRRNRINAEAKHAMALKEGKA